MTEPRFKVGQEVICCSDVNNIRLEVLDGYTEIQDMFRFYDLRLGLPTWVSPDYLFATKAELLEHVRKQLEELE